MLRAAGGIILALAGMLVSAGAATASTCHEGISAETAGHLFALLNHPPSETDCRFEGVGTQRTRLEARWSRSGVVLPPLRVVPRSCAPGHAASTEAFVVEVPPEIGRSCPSVVPLVTALTHQLATEFPAGRTGSLRDPLFRGARGLFAAIALVALALLVRGGMRWRSLDRRWMAIGLAGFCAALVLRAALPFSMGNWYTDVLPAAGPPPWMRFGPGSFAWQALLRDAGLWNARTLLLSQLLIGAAAVPLLLAVLRELRVDLEAAAAAVILFVFAPFHARLSATASEHVLASTLCLGLLLCWMRAARTRDTLWFAAAVLLFPAVCATRVDMTVQAALTLPWPLLPDRVERDRAPRRWPAGWMIAVMAVVAAATAVAAYRLIALPSQHPMPDWQAHRFALRQFIPQFWVLATNDPRWVSLPSLVLALVGTLAMTLRRPLLLARVAGTVLLAFVASGRSLLHDELVGARYFLFTIPIFLIASGFGFEALLAIVPRRLRPLAAAAGLAGLALWAGLSARTAYAARYAFQDEYAFVRRALPHLPAPCTVYQVPLRAAALPGDLDCCLDVARSPLVLEFPGLTFRDLPDDPSAVFTESACVAYYESIACEIAPHDRPGRELARTAAQYFQQRCGEARRRGRLAPIAETETSSRTTENFFADKRPHARLYRWGP
jgi:hypothetical protein